MINSANNKTDAAGDKKGNTPRDIESPDVRVTSVPFDTSPVFPAGTVIAKPVTDGSRNTKDISTFKLLALT